MRGAVCMSMLPRTSCVTLDKSLSLNLSPIINKTRVMIAPSQGSSGSTHAVRQRPGPCRDQSSPLSPLPQPSLPGFCFVAPLFMKCRPWEDRPLSQRTSVTRPAAHLRSFWLMKPSFSFSTALASMELASLAKSRSRISDTGTDTMAKASLSSLVGQVPSCRDRGQQGHSRTSWGPARAPAPGGPHHEPDGPLLLDVNGHVGALDPGVGAQVPQPDIGVPAGRTRSAPRSVPRSTSQPSALHPRPLHTSHLTPHPAATGRGTSLQVRSPRGVTCCACLGPWASHTPQTQSTRKAKACL